MYLHLRKLSNRVVIVTPIAEYSPEIKSYYSTGQQAIQGLYITRKTGIFTGNGLLYLFLLNVCVLATHVTRNSVFLVKLGDEPIRQLGCVYR